MIIFETLCVLLILMIIGALIAVETSNLLSAVISVGAVGFLAAIAFLILGAPDVAIAQIVVEILCLVILIRATIRRGLKTASGSRGFFSTVATVVMVAVVAVFGAGIFAEFPQFGTPVMERFSDAPSATYIQEGLQKTGAPNIVTAVLLDFRAYDTLGEATVLFCSILGALAILRTKARKKVAEPDEETCSVREQVQKNEGMSLIVKTVTRCLKGFILLYGIYIVLYGHLTPGGGFAGGVILACAFILLTLAEGQRTGLKTLGKAVASELDSVGALVFLAVAVAGLFATGGVFFKNLIATPDTAHFRLLSSGDIPICNVGIGLKVGMSLFLIFTILAAFRIAAKDDGQGKLQRGENKE